VFTNVGSKNGASVGDKFTIFRTSKPVLHPITGQQIGYKVQIEGELELLEILGKRKSTAVITSSYLEITRGAKVRPQEPFVKEVILRKGTRRVDGFIVETKNNTALSGKGDIVYIDAGEVNNVVPGNVFSIYTQPRKAHDPDAHKDVIIPGTLIGKIVVLEVKEGCSTGIITESSRQIELGDYVSLDI
jgi:hypothetical protein